MGRNRVASYKIPKGTQQERIRHMMKTLELDGSLLSLDNALEHAVKHHSSYEDFLEMLFEKNFTFNEQRRLTRWVQLARFPKVKTLHEFDFSRNKTINEQQIRQLSTSRYIERGDNIVFMGPPGVGKTHLATALGIEAIDKGFDVRFIKLNEIVDLVNKTSIEGMQRLIRSLVRPKLLIMDDIDFYDVSEIPNVNEFIFTLVDKRDEAELSTIYITNKPFTEWHGLFGGNKIRTQAALDRILGRGTVIVIDGVSQRIERVGQTGS